MDSTGFKKALEEEKDKLEKEIRAIARPSPAVPGEWEPLPKDIGAEADVLDQAELVTSHEDDAAVLADLEARYQDVIAALARIGDGSYGTCEVCGKPIETERLSADPTAGTCLEHR